MRLRPTILFTFPILLVTAGLVAQPLSAQSVEGIVTAGTRAAAPGPATSFTGKVSARPVVDARQMGNPMLGEVTFAPGARSNWHVHPGGAALYVIAGCGGSQREGGPIVRICRGNTAFVPAGVRHWRRATATRAMTHLPITGNVGATNVHWIEPVNDAQYGDGEKKPG